MKASEYKALVAAQKKGRASKYGNRKVERDGEVFDSAREANRFPVLKDREKAGEIRNLKRQVRYDFTVNGVKIGWYVADYVYDEKFDGMWNLVVEDVKGFRTDIYKYKRKLMRAIHNIEIRET